MSWMEKIEKLTEEGGGLLGTQEYTLTVFPLISTNFETARCGAY